MPHLKPIKLSSASISNISNLCASLDIEEIELNTALGLSAFQRYTQKEVVKKNGAKRKVYNPHFLIRKIQARINTRIFSDSNIIQWPEYIYGTIPNQIIDEEIYSKDYIACAQNHCESKSIASLDIQDFFDNIHQSLVEEMFEEFFKYPKNISQILANICCLDGHVVQGALTSSYIAALCLYDVEFKCVERLMRKNLVYTRLVDDITISSKVSNYDFSFAISLVENMLASKDLPLNLNKTRIQYVSTQPLTVHGLRVAFKNPRLPSDEVRKIRAAVKNVEILASEKNYRTSHSYRKDFNRCMGRVNKLARIGHKQHTDLVHRLKKVFPLASSKDLKRMRKTLDFLKKDSGAGVKNNFWYQKRYYWASERLNIIKRSFPKAAEELRQELRLLKPIDAK
jgi:RNA-directed DNA polymerase